GFTRENRDAIFDLRRTSIAIEGRLHPLFVRHLQGGFGDRVAAGFNVSLGLGADLLSVAGGEGDAARDDTYARFALGLGLGLDIPLTEPDDHPWSLWLGLGVQLRFVGFPDAPSGLHDMDEKVFALQLGVRFHDISGVRFPVPPELNDTDR